MGLKLFRRRRLSLGMRAIVITSGGVIASKVVSAWILSGNSVVALWAGSKSAQVAQKNRTLGLVARAWSLSAIARRYKIPIWGNPRLSTWREACTKIEALQADVLITVMTHEIVPDNVLALFPGCAVNFHPALLPYYRGPRPRLGLLLDDKAASYGGMTLHCLKKGIDEGDIIGSRSVPHDEARGFVHWDVCLARAGGDLANTELQAYLKGVLKPKPQPVGIGNYRKIHRSELTLSDERGADQIKWLCDLLGETRWLRFRDLDAEKKSYVVSRFIRRLGPRTHRPPRIARFFIEFDAADFRVRVGRPGFWVPLFALIAYLRAIFRTRGCYAERGIDYRPRV